MQNYRLNRSTTAVLIIDVQEKLFAHIERPCEVLDSMQKMVQGAQLLKLPIVVTEQYPKGLGSTIGALKKLLGDHQQYYSKTSFSCMDDATIRNLLTQSPIEQWILIGIEAHVCVLQTAKQLLLANKQVTVLNDAISSRSIYNYSTAIAEMRDCGVRISCTETVLFELLGDSLCPEFKRLSELLKN